ncbi:hypothetical protein [Candidatus Poriferisodalis sp.]|uniref:hypothetical protein n=1 Tax=Candidatus Poriferisodalis sp. TaxID=3101277 RepID=UPI003B01622D
MVGIASRYFAGRIALAAAAALAIGVLTGMDGAGHVVMYATIVLGTAAGAFGLLFALALTVGDGDSLDREHSHRYQPVPAYWPIMAATGLGVLMVGLVTDALLTIAGMALLVISAIEWTMSAWAEHLSSDATENAVERARLLRPFEISLYGALGIAVPVVLASRIFLTVSKAAASYAAIVISAVILAFAFVLYAKPQLRRAFTASVLVLGGIALIVAGITSAVIGERDFHPHGHTESSGDHAEESGDHAESPGPVVDHGDEDADGEPDGAHE